MQAEFLNIFMDKQQTYLVDTTNRLIMAESKLVFAEKGIEAKQRELDESIKRITELEDTVENLKFEFGVSESTVKQILSEKNNILDELNKAKFKIQEKENEVQAIKSELNTVKFELSNAKQLEKNMVVDFQKLQADYEELKGSTFVMEEPAPVKKTKGSAKTKV